MVSARILWLAVTVLLSVGCGRHPLDGKWAGNLLAGDAGTSTLLAEFHVADTQVTGTLSVPQFKCLAISEVDFQAKNGDLVGSVSAGNITADVTATYTDNTINGTLDVRTGSCAGAKGFFSAVR